MSEQPQSQNGHNQITTSPNKNEYPAFKTAVKVGFVRIGIFIHDFREEIVAVGTLFIAVFTVVLAFATGFLYFATRDLVKGAEKTAQTQLRAFVFGQGINAVPNVFRDRQPSYIK